MHADTLLTTHSARFALVGVFVDQCNGPYLPVSSLSPTTKHTTAKCVLFVSTFARKIFMIVAAAILYFDIIRVNSTHEYLRHHNIFALSFGLVSILWNSVTPLNIVYRVSTSVILTKQYDGHAFTSDTIVYIFNVGCSLEYHSPR